MKTTEEYNKEVIDRFNTQFSDCMPCGQNECEYEGPDRCIFTGEDAIKTFILEEVKLKESTTKSNIYHILFALKKDIPHIECEMGKQEMCDLCASTKIYNQGIYNSMSAVSGFDSSKEKPW